MAYTNSNLIRDALQDVGIIAVGQEPSATQAKRSLQELDDMLESWATGKRIDIGWSTGLGLTDDFPCPTWARMAVRKSLAIALAGVYSAPLSPALIDAQDVAYRSMQTYRMTTFLDNTDMSHLPSGTGTYGTGYDITNDT